MRKIYTSLLATFLVTSVLFANVANAASSVIEPKHKIVIQVSTDDVRTQNIAMNNAVNLQKALGQDNVAIELVAYGPGFSMMTRKSKVPVRVSSLALQDITFSACNNTMKKVAKKTGKMPVLLDGVRIVPAGVLRIMELQEQGYSYIRP